MNGEPFKNVMKIVEPGRKYRNTLGFPGHWRERESRQVILALNGKTGPFDDGLHGECGRARCHLFRQLKVGALARADPFAFNILCSLKNPILNS